MEHIFPIKKKEYFAEIEQEGKNQFIELYSMYFDIEEYKYLKEIECLEDSVMWNFIKLLDNNIPKANQYIYKIITYKADENKEDIWNFNESISDYKEYGFTDIMELLHFCKDKFGITSKDFVDKDKTHIP